MKSDEISKETRYTTRHKYGIEIVKAVLPALLVGSGVNIYKDNEYKNTINDMKKNNTVLTKQIDDLKDSNDKFENQINELKAANESLKQNNERKLLEEMPSGYYKPSSDVFLLDKYKMVNPEECDSFENGSCLMKGETYNNGFFMSYSGGVSFYLKKKYKLLRFSIGPVDDNETEDRISLRIFVDGNQIDTVINRNYDDVKECSIEIPNVNELKFEWSIKASSHSYALGNIKVYE